MTYGLSPVGPFRFTTKDSEAEKPKKDNGRFTLMDSSAGVRVANNFVTFTPEYINTPLRPADTFYRTCFGPFFHHSGEIYGATNHNLSLALTRLTGARDTTPLGTIHSQLEKNQHAFVDKHKKILCDYGHNLQLHCDNYSDFYQATHDLIMEPHQKRALRKRAWNKLIESNKIASATWMLHTKGNVKREEYAKPKKKPRLVNDLTTGASLLGALVTASLKHAMADFPFEYLGHKAYFIGSPKIDILNGAFDHIINGAGYDFIFFSDDSCIGLMENGKRVYYNMDISSCDASHTSSLFSTLLMISRGKNREIIRRLIKQCKTPLKIKTRNKPYQFVKFKTKTPVLYSGSTLTTLANNMANILLFMAIVDAAARSEEEIIRACEDAGYIVTLKRCDVPGDLQFLKHSPWMDGRRPIAVLNIGVIMRASGACKRDLPGRAKEGILARATRFQAGLMACFKNLPQNDFIASLTHHQTNETIAHDSWLITELQRIGDFFRDIHIPSSHFIERYKLTLHEWAELIDLCSSASFGDCIRCNASAKILALDYGL